MNRRWLIQRLEEWGDRNAIVWHGQSFSYGWLRGTIDEWQSRLVEIGIKPGQVVALDGDYSPLVCALLLALIENRNIIVPLTSATRDQRRTFLDISEVEHVFSFDQGNMWEVVHRSNKVNHPLLRQLQEAGAAGLVLFSSGSTGESKAALHDFDRLLEKFKSRRHCLCTLTFLLLDHIGGINTLIYTLSNGGTTVFIENRNPEVVCRVIERHKVELLPTSPTFLNLLLISEEYKRFDLSSLKLITYGTEAMPATTLQRINAAFPSVKLKQTYGLSELGILSSRSRDSSSLWVKVGGEGFETKVVNNILWIRAKSAMLGYLNASSSFDEEGWFNTQDVVEVNGEYIRILGREADIINVGGEKVYPAEVESVLLQMENVADVTVYGETNPILGNIVVATFIVFEPETLGSLKKRVLDFCKDKLARYKIPVRVCISDSSQFSSRYKKVRRSVSPGTGTQ